MGHACRFGARLRPRRLAFTRRRGFLLANGRKRIGDAGLAFARLTFGRGALGPAFARATVRLLRVFARKTFALVGPVGPGGERGGRDLRRIGRRSFSRRKAARAASCFWPRPRAFALFADAPHPFFLLFDLATRAVFPFHPLAFFNEGLLRWHGIIVAAIGHRASIRPHAASHAAYRDRARTQKACAFGLEWRSWTHRAGSALLGALFAMSSHPLPLARDRSQIGPARPRLFSLALRARWNSHASL